MPFRSSRRSKERSFYEKTAANAAKGRRDLQTVQKKTQRNAPTSRLRYQIPTALIGLSVLILGVLLIQYLCMTWHNLLIPEANRPGFLYRYPYALPLQLLFVFLIWPTFTWYLHHRFKAVWTNNNATYLSDDLEEYANDAYVRTMDHICREFEAAPDAGMGFHGHVSAIVGHAMMDNKGIKPRLFPVFDPDVPGQIKKDENGNIQKKSMPVFDKQLAISLFHFSNVGSDAHYWYDATSYTFNERTSKKEQKQGHMRKGAFGRKGYDTLADYINAEFYPLDTDSARPAGVYFYDSRPVNTILIAITRGGKGQTYLEACLDLWSRESKPWNVFSTDPKGGAPRLVVKSNYLAA